MKTAICSKCKRSGHYAAFCTYKPTTKPRVVRKAVRKATKPRRTRGQLVSDLDSIFSQYIRLREAVDGLATCVTCGDTRFWRLQQNGHYFTRGRYSTRWDEANCHVQCKRCNIFLHGNYITYTFYMLETYGKPFIDELEKRSLTLRRYTHDDLREMTVYYGSLVAQLTARTNA